MKEEELRQHTNCSKCKKPILSSGIPLFWTVKIECHGTDLGAIKRQDGLTALIGGNVRLAQVMGADEEMTHLIKSVELTLCQDCAMDVMELIEDCKE